MIRARVVKNYKRAYDDPIRMRAGDIVTAGKNDPENPRWIWCEHADGRAGWVPEEYLDIDVENNQATAIEDYNALELIVSADQELGILKRECGWAFCRTLSGEEGWVPETHIESIDGAKNEQ